MLIIFLPLKTQAYYVPVVTLSVKDNQKLSKLLSKGFAWSVYWNEYRLKSASKILTMSIYIFASQTLQELTYCLFWVI